jgi:hypothetical protein
MAGMTDGPRPRAAVPGWLPRLTGPEDRLWAAFRFGRQVEYRDGDEIRAEVVAALALGAVSAVPGRTAGVRIRGATIVGELDLRHGQIEVPLTMMHCRFTGSVRLEESTTRSLDLTASRLVGLCATGAHIRGSIDLTDAQLLAGGEETALLQKVTVDTDLVCHGMRCLGLLSLVGARIGAVLDLSEASLEHPGAVAANLGGASVARSVYLDRARVAGHLRMPGMDVGGVLSLSGAVLSAPPAEGPFAHQSLTGESLSAGGNASFDELTAAAQVDLTGGRFGGRLTFKRARLATTFADWPALIANAATVARGLYIGDEFHARGAVRLTGVQIGGHLDIYRMDPDSGPLELYSARATTVRDGKTSHGRYVGGGIASWPAEVQLDGFTYEAFDPYLPAEDRIALLRRQPNYAAQPYEFMAAYYRALGHDLAAREVLIEKERVRHADFHRLSRIGSVISNTALGYGYLPRRAAYIAVAVQVLASVFYAFAVPTAIHPGDHVTYYPVLYAADLFVPIVHFGQADAFQSHGFAACVAYVLPYLGWALGVAIVAGASRTLSKGGGGIV